MKSFSYPLLTQKDSKLRLVLSIIKGISWIRSIGIDSVNKKDFKSFKITLSHFQFICGHTLVNLMAKPRTILNQEASSKIDNLYLFQYSILSV